MVSKKEAIMSKTAKRRPSAVVFELEYVGTNGRQVSFEALSGVLEKKGLSLTAAQFTRFCTERHPQDFLTALLRAVAKDRVTDEKTVDEVKAAIAGAFANTSLKPATGLKKLLAAATEHGMALGCVSALDRDPMQALATTLGLVEAGVTLFSNVGGRLAVPGVEAWLKVAKAAGASPSRCLALVASSASCRSALKAHMHCVAVPDRFTECADFGGADFVVKALDGLDTPSSFAVLETGL